VTRSLLLRCSRGDGRAREQVIERFLPLARQLARRYERGREPLDDLVQVACVGLIKAVDRFDCERGTSFSSYAVPMMLGELRRHFRDTGWAAHVPRAVQERVLEIDGVVDRLSATDGERPTAKRIATELGLPMEDVLEALQARGAGEATSLQAPIGDEDGATRADLIPRQEMGYELVEYGSIASATMAALGAREREMLHLRFIEDLTQAEIAERVGCSQMQVSRLLRRSLERLRAVVSAAGDGRVSAPALAVPERAG
jgi:RNA polymerase sigma-B factor